MNIRTQKSALKALDGMRDIVEAERLVHGIYETSAPTACGTKFCAVGSLWVGAGQARFHKSCGSVFVVLPDVNPGARSTYMRHRPGLRAAYDALNAAAERYMDAHDIVPDRDFYGAYVVEDPIDREYLDQVGMLERLFEGYRRVDEDEVEFRIGRDELLQIIDSAREAIAAA